MARNIPIRRSQFDVGRFLAFVGDQGGEIGQPTNPYEVVRYRAYWRGTKTSAVHVVYAKESGLLTWTGGSEGHYRAFLDGAPMDELPSAKPVNKPKVKTVASVSKSTKVRRNLIERDGNGCWFCGEAMTPFDTTIEHLIPKSKGGTNALANYALAHRQCNADAADLPLVEKIAMRARLHKEQANV